MKTLSSIGGGVKGALIKFEGDVIFLCCLRGVCNVAEKNTKRNKRARRGLRIEWSKASNLSISPIEGVISKTYSET